MSRYGPPSALRSTSATGCIENGRITVNNAAYSTSEPPATEELAPGRRSRLTRSGHLLLGLLPGIALIVFWQWAAGRLIKEIYISKPTAVAQRLYEIFASGEIYPHLWTTAQELVLGYVIGVALGVIGGYALGRSPRMAGVLEPYVMAFYGIPKIALAPLFIIWFGIGIRSKVALASIMVFFLVIPYSVIGVIVGEFTSSIQGLGLFIHEASATYDPAGVFAGITILLVFVIAANLLANRLERRLLRWRTPSGVRPNEI